MIRLIVTAKTEVPAAQARMLMEEFNSIVKGTKGVQLVNYFPRFETSVVETTEQSVTLDLPPHLSENLVIRPERTMKM